MSARRLLFVWLILASSTCSTSFPLVEMKDDGGIFPPPRLFSNSSHPVVIMHGMGDAADNSGMQRIRKKVSDHLHVYAVNIAIGDSISQDTKNGFFMNLDDQVTLFAAQVKKDKKLQNGFNAFGFSQGNLIIRGYIHRFNNPPVFTFLSVHGPMMGVGALPQCAPTAVMCKTIDSLISHAAYSSVVQGGLAQANYYRDPYKMPTYQHYARFLPDINNEKLPVSNNSTYTRNFLQLERLVLVKAKKDTMVFPSESEWFGEYAPKDYATVLSMKETEGYKTDSFGLQSLHTAKKIHFESTEGNHLDFSIQQLLQWIDRYFD